MNWDRVEGNWKQFKGNVKEKWGKLTDDQLDVIAGKRDQLSGKPYGFHNVQKEGSMAPLLLFGAALGGAAMYLLDPDRGRRRRALLRDQAVKATSNVKDVLDAGVRDLANRGSAATGRLRSLFKRRAATDDVLVERVRSKLGRYVGHPGAIDVAASNGHVTLSGSVLRHEHDELLQAVRDVAGVSDIADQLAVHDTAEGVSELQGGRQRRGELAELLQDNWAPGTRIVAGAAGTTMALYALRGGVVGLVIGAAGALILLRTTTNKPFRRLAGMRTHRAIDTQGLKTTLETSETPRDTAQRDTGASVSA